MDKTRAATEKPIKTSGSTYFRAGEDERLG